MTYLLVYHWQWVSRRKLQKSDAIRNEDHGEKTRADGKHTSRRRKGSQGPGEMSDALQAKCQTIPTARPELSEKSENNIVFCIETTPKRW